MNDLESSGGVGAVLLHPEQWRVVGPFAGNVAPARDVDEQRVAWSCQNAHKSAAREILLSVGGAGFFGMDGKLYPCRPGYLFIIDPGVLHDNYYPSTASGLEHVWIGFSKDRALIGWFAVENGRLYRRQEHIVSIAQEQVGVAFASFPDPGARLAAPLETARLRCLLGLVAVTLFSGYKAGGSVSPSLASTSAKVVDAVRQHIEDSVGKGASLDFLAQFSGYSKFHLMRLFRERMGCSIHEYINRQRRQRARELEQQGTGGAAIADTLGFSCAQAYYHWRLRQGAGFMRRARANGYSGKQAMAERQTELSPRRVGRCSRASRIRAKAIGI